MEITILNANQIDSEFHEMVSGPTGTALRKAAKDYLGSRNLSENQLRDIQRSDPQAFEALEAEMTSHALNVVSLDQNTGITLRLNLEGNKLT